jgi:hypothetical protein
MIPADACSILAGNVGIGFERALRMLRQERLKSRLDMMWFVPQFWISG